MTKPNLNDVATRIRYLLDGGKIRRSCWAISSSYLEFKNNRFQFNCGQDSMQSLDNAELFKDSSGWELYEEPKTEEDLRKEFAAQWEDIMTRYSLPIDKALGYAKLLFDTFELKKK